MVGIMECQFLGSRSWTQQDGNQVTYDEFCDVVLFAVLRCVCVKWSGYFNPNVSIRSIPI